MPLCLPDSYRGACSVVPIAIGRQGLRASPSVGGVQKKSTQILNPTFPYFATK